jgi:preprotein translocase subunit SecA
LKADVFKWISNLVDSNEKVIRRFESAVQRINALEPGFTALPDGTLKAKSDEFKTRIKGGVPIDEILPEAFAAVREAARRAIGQRHFDVQLMGGMVLHQGKIAEMKTGEGKTLVATLPLYLNSLEGKGCHLVTVNDYLAKRDAHWMGAVFGRLGVSVASITGPEKQADVTQSAQVSYLYDQTFESSNSAWRHLRPVSRREAYAADITYGTNNEFGFDYLRDNMVLDAGQCVQRPLHYAIVDEVDNILIDEARTPLIISGSEEGASQKYALFAKLAVQLKEKKGDEGEGDYVIDEKTRTATPTDQGIDKAERFLAKNGQLKAPELFDPSNYELTRYLDAALKAQALFRLDRDYVVKDGQVVIVDEFTGRLMFGRRYAEGLHQAIEAKEGVKVQKESVTYATVTFQNYFRMYEKLAGMTGTALTEAEEFNKIYKLDVVEIPTNRPLQRDDLTDLIYRDEPAKFNAIAKHVAELHKEQKPVLVGTASIEKSEALSAVLRRQGVPHQVLNAKYHEKEAGIIAQAGSLGAVTVATNMAGRGVDIILGGNPAEREQGDWQKEHDRVVELGGLNIIGSERHEARRIDNQLRGRAGRQGDPGTSRFFVSLEDDIMRRFGGDRIKTVMNWAGFDDETPIENRMVNRAIENAQVKVEGYHFDMRKHLVEYDDVVNKHREVIYAERRKVMGGADLKQYILSMVEDEVEAVLATHWAPNAEPVFQAIMDEIKVIFAIPPELTVERLAEGTRDEASEAILDVAEVLYNQREAEFGAERMRLLERLVMLKVIDSRWKDHLTDMEHMRQEVGLHAVGQEKPLYVYQKKGFELFDELMAAIRKDVARMIYQVKIVEQPATAGAAKPPNQKAVIPAPKGIGRNDLCPCGSGKKYKKCCGREQP